MPKISPPFQRFSEITCGVPIGLLGRSPAHSRRCPDLSRGGACRRAVFCDKFAVFLWCEPRKNGGITRRNQAAANFPFWSEIRLVATGITSFDAGFRAAGARFSPCIPILGGYGRVSSRRIAGRASFGRVTNFYFFCGESPMLRRLVPSSPRVFFSIYFLLFILK
jgi:hypothetical protein